LNGSAAFAKGSDLARELTQFLAACRRQLLVVVLSMLLAGLIGFAIIANLPRLYTATSLVLIDNRRVRAVESNYDVSPTFDATSFFVESQVEVVKSGQVAEIVIKKMNLLEKPLPRPALSIFGLIWTPYYIVKDFLVETFSSQSDPAKSRNRDLEDTIARLQREVDVQHLPRTMVLQISYTAVSPALAADMANAYADAYIADQLNAKYEATRRASSWLEARLSQLKQKALDASLAVQRYRADNNLISSSGKLVNEQQITELNTQLVNARTERARAEARHARLRSIIDTHETQAVVSDAFGSTIVENLRSKYLDASKREAELTARVGRDHLSAVGLRQEMQEYERLIFSELSRLEEAYRSEVNISHVKEVALSESLEKLLGVAAKENKLLVALHDLEQEGETARALYQTYLQRYQESLQQQTFPIVEARIITPALEPEKPAYPRKALLTLLFLSIGGLAGACIGVLREFRERGFSNQEQLRDELGLGSLGIVPLITNISAEANKSPPRQSKHSEPSKSEGSGTKPAAGHAHDERLISLVDGGWTYAVTHPNSTMGEALLASKLAADIRDGDEPCKIIGMISALPNEGKTLFAINLSLLLASRKKRVLLIDGDLRMLELSKNLAPRATGGLLEVITSERDPSEVFYSEPNTGLCFLPTVSRIQITHSSDVLASAGMQRFLAQMKPQFDYIVIDLPPLAPVVDTRAIASEVNSFILVVEWRRTPRRIVRDLLREDPRIFSKCLGAVLNKVDIRKLRLFEEPGSRLYHYQTYTKSYYFDGR
jgi:succinoglycan biosynthesis transport protein ExoP